MTAVTDRRTDRAWTLTELPSQREMAAGGMAAGPGQGRAGSIGWQAFGKYKSFSHSFFLEPVCKAVCEGKKRGGGSRKRGRGKACKQPYPHTSMILPTSSSGELRPHLDPTHQTGGGFVGVDCGGKWKKRNMSKTQ